MANEKILIVEDEAVVALNLQTLLRRLGYQVIGRVDNGASAIEKVSQAEPDLILMDIRLKGDLDGIETAQVIHSESNVPIIFLTAYNDDNTVKRAMGTRSFGYLIKPFDERQLHIAIQLELHKRLVDQKLHAQTNQLRHIVDSIPQGIALIDNNGRIKHRNQLFSKYVDILNHKIAIVEEDNEHLDQYLLEEWSQNSVTDDWHEVIIDKPVYQVFEARIYSLTDSDDSKTNSGAGESERILIIRDQTKQRMAIQRDLQQEKLATIGQLAAGISHDFNNILASLQIQSDLMRMKSLELSSYHTDRIKRIDRDIHRARDLVNQILDFSRSSTRDSELLLLNDVIEDVIELLDRTMPDSIQFNCQPASTPIQVEGNRTQLMQVVMNLALNARDAMPNGGTLVISATQLEDLNTHHGFLEGSWTCIQVEDTGIGMSEEVSSHVFEPFFTTKFALGGTGLGLAQAYGLVQQHGGYIDFSSRIGEGTTFKVYLPIIGEFHGSDEAQSPQKIESASPSKPKGILIVEDDEYARESLNELLQMVDYHVICATNGLDALEKLRLHSNEIDMVLSDVMMPKMTGLQLYHEVSKTYANLPFGFMTGYAAESEISEINLASQSQVLKKPFSVENLFAFLEDLAKPQFKSV